jgi:hypothetical protein
LAGDCDVFATAAGAAISAVGFRNGAGDFIGVDPAVCGCLGELARLAIGPRCGRAALLAACEAFIDAVAIRLICNNEDAAIGEGGCRGHNNKAGGKRRQKSHDAPVFNDGDRAIIDTPELLKMINRRSPSDQGNGFIKLQKRAFAALTPQPRLDHCAAHERFSRQYRHLPRDY